jgi:hypothetical protein
MKSPGEIILSASDRDCHDNDCEPVCLVCLEREIAAAQAESWNAALKKAATLANRRTRLSRDAKDGQLAREILALQKEVPQ